MDSSGFSSNVVMGLLCGIVKRFLQILHQLCNGIDSAWERYVFKQKTEPIEETSCVVEEHLDYKLADILTTD